MFITLLIAYALILVILFYLLAKICDEYFVFSLEIISKKLKISGDVAGATFMAIGSSAPELFTAIIALAKPNAENIGAGTIVGSAIFNILVIIGISAVVSTAYLNWQPVLRDGLFYSISIIILLFTFSDGKITLNEAILYTAMYGLYLISVIYWHKILPYKSTDEINKNNDTEDKTIQAQNNVGNKKNYFFKKISNYTNKIFNFIFPNLEKNPNKFFITFLLSILLIAVFSWGLVEIAIKLAHLLSISESIIALTILAGGTSIPDLISSVIVAKKGRGGMAISNSIGSNIFDILVGLGAPWLIFIAIREKEIKVSSENLLSSIFLLFFTVIAVIFIIAVQKFKIGRKAGYFLISLYICYLGYAIYQAMHPEIPTIDEFLRKYFYFQK
jgi:K+-dependent Na+/Ca+ exchanger-like protein